MDPYQTTILHKTALRLYIRSFLYLLLSLVLDFSDGYPIPREAITEIGILRSERIFTDDFMPIGSACTRGGPFDYPKCAPGMWCIGKKSPKCTKLRTPGQSCGTEYEKCSRGAFCNKSKVCESAPAMDTHYIKKDGNCVDGKTPKCFPGLWCIVGKCRKLVPCGKQCGEDWQRCRPGLKCRTIYPSKAKVCTRYFGSLTVLQEGEECGKNMTSKCITGLRCTRISPTKQECTTPKRLGQSCRNDSSMCEYERVCVKTKYSNGTICVERKDEGESCDKKISVCKNGFRCEKIGSTSKCVIAVVST